MVPDSAVGAAGLYFDPMPALAGRIGALDAFTLIDEVSSPSISRGITKSIGLIRRDERTELFMFVRDFHLLKQP
jgi:hypothetical protein